MAHKIEHTQKAKDRILYQYKDKPNFSTLIEIFADRWNQFEDMYAKFQNKFNIDYASDKLLDYIAEIVGVSRDDAVDFNGLEDFFFRIFVRQKIGINSSKITFKDVYDLWRLGIQEEYNVEISEVYPAQVDFYTDAPLNPALKDKFLEMMNDVVGVGISVGNIVIGEANRPFAFKSEPENTDNFGFGDVNDETVGGYLSGIL